MVAGISAISWAPTLWAIEASTAAHNAQPVAKPKQPSVFSPVQIVPVHQLDTISSMAKTSSHDAKYNARDTLSSIRDSSSFSYASLTHGKPEADSLHGKNKELDKLEQEIRARHHQQHLLGPVMLF
jgi:hypothetical protein